MHISFDELPDQAFIRMPTVEALTGLKRASIYDYAKRGAFPPPEKLGYSNAAHAASGWRVGQIRAWLRNPAGWAADATVDAANAD